MQYLPRNEEPFSAGKQSFEQNITPTRKEDYSNFTTKTQSDSFFEEAFRRSWQTPD
jgi:hypothetical protein